MNVLLKQSIDFFFQFEAQFGAICKRHTVPYKRRLNELKCGPPKKRNRRNRIRYRWHFRAVYHRQTFFWFSGSFIISNPKSKRKQLFFNHPNGFYLTEKNPRPVEPLSKVINENVPFGVIPSGLINRTGSSPLRQSWFISLQFIYIYIRNTILCTLFSLLYQRPAKNRSLHSRPLCYSFSFTVINSWNA